MASVTLDLIENGSVRRTVDGWQIQRVAHVSGLTGNKSTILARCVQVAGIPQIGDAHPNVPGATVTGHYAIGGIEGDGAMVFITYESKTPDEPTGSGGQPNFIVTDDTSLRTVQIQRIGNKALRAVWSPDGNPSNPAAQADTLTINTEERVHDLTLWGVVSGTGRNMDLFRDAVGTVNRDLWHGKPQGSWMWTRFASETQDRGRSYAVTAVLSRRTNGRVWCNSGLLRHKDSGKYVTLRAADTEDARKAEHEYPSFTDVQGGTFKHFNGAMVVYPYLLRDFRLLLGLG